jgi:heme O synthase-like polyprenyltransferase
VPEALEALPGVRARPVIRPAAAAVVRDYVTLTKPRIMSLLVLTSVCAMVAAAGGAPAPLPLAALLVGGALACGGASALNHVLDRDIDRLMGPRTASRPVAAGRIAPAHAAAFLFLIVLLWTPPHFWALALLLAPHYEAAGVPMMPVVRGTSATTARMLLYTLALVAATIAPVLTGNFGVVYLAGAGVLDGVLCALAWRVRRESTPRRAGVLFHYSLLYLALLSWRWRWTPPCTEPDRSFSFLRCSDDRHTLVFYRV